MLDFEETSNVLLFTAAAAALSTAGYYAGRFTARERGFDRYNTEMESDSSMSAIAKGAAVGACMGWIFGGLSGAGFAAAVYGAISKGHHDGLQSRQDVRQRLGV